MIKIIKATPEDSKLIATLGQQTFRESHGHSAPKEDIDRFILNTYNTDAIFKEFENKKAVYHLLYYDNQLAGFSKIQLETPNANLSDKNITKLDRIYLLDAFQGKQLGVTLLDFNIALSKQHNQNGLWLVVWVENKKAIQFYNKKGFKIVGAYDFNISKTHSNPNHVMFLEY
ncbi:MULTISPECIES: GNAT family N-acetyltransferase [unclassified Olleya]|jgi:ribosomal protein S18 acetylase RimI-like enzyme|uniref:GNAT family N-acetyltransferase n=1 Tax=unclassified Olleya TaxID=2615019 RepID=UPI0011A0A907|nr:GNAT family N-acetyltransferase [Olleya sp. Hel_I_94]TVZ46933.1 ribosomal protein S18 acetylase RimI-like enzyme [Olleya sp. Hel_I_94]|tara:strand:+ start:36030 stop:36545 length:516 start_codon:yes stop_codon:yes gene_type:complete